MHYADPGVQRISVCHGFTLWRRAIARSVLAALNSRAVFTGRTEDPVHRAKTLGAGIVVWASEETPDLATRCAAERIPLVRMEDGFIRSVGLGSDFSWPYSMVLDRGGIYFDPRSMSDLERILAEFEFDTALLQRAVQLRQRIVSGGVTKYHTAVGAARLETLPTDRKVLLVPGQVPQDASVVRGGGAIQSNLGLLKAVREANPDAYIIYKPHPDVARGNRNGALHPDDVKRLADLEITDLAIAPLFERVDEVHTLTSLAGFEALLRGKPVHTYGGPFYAGWGLTQDRLAFPRRRRRLTPAQLVAGTLLLYPRYFDWTRNTFQSPERALEQLAIQALPLRLKARSRVFFVVRGLLKHTGLMSVLRRRAGKQSEIPKVERDRRESS